VVNERRAALEAATHFRLDSPPADATPIESGHIHETWVVRTHDGRRFVLQRLNEVVFPDLDSVTRNLVQICAVLDLPNRPVLTTDDEPRWGRWRVFPYLEGTSVIGSEPTREEVEEVARAFGEFHRRAAALDPEQLAVTIPNFHDPSARLSALDMVVVADPIDRAKTVVAELEEVSNYRWLAGAAGAIDPPTVLRRVAHFDAKAANVLLDDATGRARAIIDLDTVMPGSVLWDVGDLARSLTATAPEDSRHPDRVGFSEDRFAVLVTGYRREADAFLTPAEIDGLTVAPVIVTFEQAVRFLTDYLAGDRYYRVARPAHNLDRGRTQLALLKAMLAAGLGPAP
jgi:N-acetylhexosamine 1-kinase